MSQAIVNRGPTMAKQENMMNTQSTQVLPRPPRKISFKQQQSVDEMLQLVADQTRKISLSEADYRIQKRLEEKPFESEIDQDFFDDSSSNTTGSDRSYSPPANQDRLPSSLIWDAGLNNKNKRSSSTTDLLLGKCAPRGLPPLDKVQHPRPPSRLSSRDQTNDEQVALRRPQRPTSARGQRTASRARGLTT